MTSGLVLETLEILKASSVSNYQTGSLVFTGQAWLAWSAEGLNKALIDARQKLDRNSVAFTPEVKLQLDLSKDTFRTTDNSKVSEWRKLNEYNLLGNHKDGLFDMYFAMHMPPRISGERVQPFATLNDGTVLLPRGQVLELRAKVTRYHKLDTKDRHCHDGPSLYSWQARTSLNAFPMTQKMKSSYELSRLAFHTTCSGANLE